MSRPNIVLFMPDQLRADAVGAFGSGVAHTPVVDELARRGTAFRQAFGQHSVCAQSRISMFTGWYPHVYGHRTLENLLKPWQPNVFRLLREAGYFVAQAGPRGDMLAPGVTQASFDWHGLTVRPEKRRPVNTDVSPAMADALYLGRRADEPTIDYDEAAIRTAEHLLREGMPEPWVLFIPLFFPHPPFEVEDPWFSLHDRASMPDPLPPVLDRKPSFMRALRDSYGLERLGPADWAEIQAVYHGMVSRIDSQLGRVLAAVERAGATDRTAVFHFTDHGEYLGDFGLVEKWPAGVDECLVRNPLVIALPDGVEGQVRDELVELVDLTPTLLELADVEPPYTQFGHSLVPMLGGAPGGRPIAFSEGGHREDEPHVLEDAPKPYHLKSRVQQDDPRTVGKVVAARTADWTYVHRLYEGGELYDRRADPREADNLVGQPGTEAIERELRDRILDWLLATGDVVPLERDPRFPSGDELSPPYTSSAAAPA